MDNKIKNNQFNFELNFFSGLVMSTLILSSLIVGTVVIGQTNAIINQKVAENNEVARPAALSVVMIKDAGCEDCFDPASVVENIILKQNTEIVSEESLEATSDKARELIEKYKIQQIPTLIVSGELNKEASLEKIWPQIGEIIEGSFVLRQTGAPYIEVESGQVRGRVSLTVLTDKSCTECYDPMVHKLILAGFGWPAESVVGVVDRQEAAGQTLIQKYKIELIPTILIEGDLEAYQALKAAWQQVGTVEADGRYIFRAGVKQMGAYKNLTSGLIIKPELPAK